MKPWWLSRSIHTALILMVGVLIYSRIFSAPFVYDDIECILLNPAINDFRFLHDSAYLKSLALSEDIYKNIVLRPMAYLTFAVNYRLHGYGVVGYHVLNVMVHLLNALLVYLITCLTLDTQSISGDSPGHRDSASIISLIPLFAALLFVAHPIQTQSVTYITQRFASLVTLFYLTSLVLYIKSASARHAQKAVLYYSGSLIAACIAMKTKETAFTLPLMLMLYEYIFIANSLKRRIAKLAPFMLTLLIIPLTVIKLKAEFSEASHASIAQSMNLVNYAGISQLDYLYSQFNVIVTYLRLLFLPINQHLIHDVPRFTSFFHLTVVLSLTLILSPLLLAGYLVHCSKTLKEPCRILVRMAAFGILWFFVALSVESTLMPLDELLVEQRVYLPSVGFMFAVVSGLVLFMNNYSYRVIQFAVAAGGIVFLMAWTTVARNEMWRDPVVLWKDTIRKSPGIVKSYINLGSHYFNVNRHGDALDSLNAGLRLNPENIETYMNIATVYQALNQYENAETTYLRAIKIQPNAVPLYEGLGRIYLLQSNFRKALPVFQCIVRLNLYSADAHIKLAKIYESLGMREQAISEYECVMRLEPQNSMVTERLGQLAEK